MVGNEDEDCQIFRGCENTKPISTKTSVNNGSNGNDGSDGKIDRSLNFYVKSSKFYMNNININNLETYNMESSNNIEDYNSISPLLNRKALKNISKISNISKFVPNIKKKFSSTKIFAKPVNQASKNKSSEFFSIVSPCDKLGRISNNFQHSNLSLEDELENTDIDDDNDDNDNIDDYNDDNDNIDEDTRENEDIEEDIEEDENEDCVSSPIQQKRNRYIRRIYSMYETTKEKNDYFMEDNSNLSKTSINTFKVVNDLLPRINENEMIKILQGDYNDEFDKFIIVDCRFDYEFSGGHIKDAINISSQQKLEENFLCNNKFYNCEKRLLIFHCEFSSCRGPNLASYLRRCDRRLNSNNYPKLSYPDIVILAGGYKNFFDKYREFCQPQGYIEMNDINYQEACKFEMDKVRQANKLPRAKSYNHFFNDSNSYNISNSYTTITSHTENSKILKRQKSTSRPLLKSSTNSISKFENKLSKFTNSSFENSIIESPSNKSTTEDDLHPSLAILKANHMNVNSFNNTSFSSSSISINSSSSSICSDSAYSSSDSLTDSSPIGECIDYFESKSTNLTNYLKSHINNSFISLSGNNKNNNNNNIDNNDTNNNTNNNNAKNSNLIPLLRKQNGLLPQSPSNRGISILSNKHMNNSNGNIHAISQNLCNLSNTSFKFPGLNNLKHKSSRHSLNKINTSSKSCLSIPLLISSPINLSSTVITPVSTVDSTSSNINLSIIDPINDTPVDFTVPFTKPQNKYIDYSRKISESLLSSGGGDLFNFASLDIDEVDEEQYDEENEGTLTDIKLSNYIGKNSFN